MHGGLQPVAAVVALPTGQPYLARMRRHRQRELRHGQAGALHEQVRRPRGLGVGFQCAGGGNVVQCQINRLQLVGHILQIGMTLPSGETVSLEGHADKYKDSLNAGAAGYVAWNPADTTLIAQ